MNPDRPFRLITWRGKTKTMAEWAREKGIAYSTLRNRLNKGWTPERAFQTPVNPARNSCAPLDLTGRRFGCLVVMGPAAKRRKRARNWRCRCDCGNETSVETARLRGGQRRCRTTACLAKSVREGSVRRDHLGRQAAAIGLRSEHIAWARMRTRARRDGTPIDPRWDASFWDFLEDVGRRPVAGWWLSREDKSGPFDATNCGWMPPAQACRGRRAPPPRRSRSGPPQPQCRRTADQQDG